MTGETAMKILLDKSNYVAGIWDPFYYKDLNSESKLSKFVAINTVKSGKFKSSDIILRPIEYSDISRGILATFNLRYAEKDEEDVNLKRGRVVTEQTILFGTMRPYLANIIVTPRAEWIGLSSPLYFPVGSEFVEILPNDRLIYFWWAFFHKRDFLDSLPKGHGGTRPRVKPETLGNLPVSVPSIEVRNRINSTLATIAERDWRSYKEKLDLMLAL